MKNIEIKINHHIIKKGILTLLAGVLLPGLMTLDNITVKATDNVVLPQAASEETYDNVYYKEAKSEPKKINFTESTIKVEKYQSVYAFRFMNVVPKVANTVSDTEGIKFRIGNPQIATVSDIGYVTGKKEGKTWLYVETPNKVTAKVYIQVTPQKDRSLVGFVEKAVKIGLKQSFNVKDIIYPTFLATSGGISKPNVKYTYRIGNSKLAKVAANGIVQGLAKGGTWLYVKSESGHETRVLLNVVDTQKQATSVTLPSSQTLNIKEKVKLNATVKPANSKVVSWRIGNNKIATINQSGVVTGVSAGGTYAYAKLANGKEVKCLIKVKNPNRLSVINFRTYKFYEDGDSIEVDRENLMLNIEHIQKVASRNSDEYSVIKASTGNSKIATVSKVENATKLYGEITVKAISSGKTWLHLETADGVKCKVLLVVKKPALKKFTMPSKITIEKSASKYLSDTTYLNIDEFYSDSVKFRVGNSNIARIDDKGRIIGVSGGGTYLYTECKGKTLKTLVSVKDTSKIKSVKLDKNVVDINVKNSAYGKVYATVSPTMPSYDSFGPWLKFKVGNEDIASVEQNGAIYGKSNGGTYVYATAPNGVTTKALVRVSGFDEIKQINAPKVVETKLSENSDRRDGHCYAAFDTDYGNRPQDIEVYIGNDSIAEITSIYRGTSGIQVNYTAKSQGGTYLYFKMPNGKIVKTLIKVHW